ncbi:alpha/beta fold hydrolase [Virgibacillus necropolis]|uniref:alpha/beta fold hydrolase n=1 Tax=Virgibacillus necropolis TaxID=163877 RepID=UPI00384AC788
MKKKYIIRMTAFIIFIVSMAVITYMPNEAESQEHPSPATVFVHGYKGTFNSFGNMLYRFEEKYNWGNKALIYRVSSEGDIRVFNLNKGKTEPVLIQVIFENNRASFEDSAKWLSFVLHHMKKQYNIDKVNIVGHSMGGLISVKYIEEYQDDSLYPATEKLITIGSPFDGIYSQTYFQINRDAAATDLKPDSAALQLLRSTKQTIPGDLKVLNIGSTGDTVAMPKSVNALRMIIAPDQLETIMIENNELGHSELHENQRVDHLIKSFLWHDH